LIGLAFIQPAQQGIAVHLRKDRSHRYAGHDEQADNCEFNVPLAFEGIDAQRDYQQNKRRTDEAEKAPHDAEGVADEGYEAHREEFFGGNPEAILLPLRRNLFFLFPRLDGIGQSFVPGGLQLHREQAERFV